MVLDFTHEESKQHFKLGCVGYAALHKERNLFNSTAIPGFFCIAHRETGGAALAMLQAQDRSFQEHMGIDIAEATESAYADKGAGIKTALDEARPNVSRFDCLEHAKKDITQKAKRKWNGVNNSRMLHRWLENTATWSPELFHVVWDRLYQMLRGEVVNGEVVSQDAIIEYMQANQVKLGEDGIWRANWQCSVLHVTPGRSTYLSNCLESIWSAYESSSPEDASKEDVTKIFDRLEAWIRTKITDKTWQDAVPSIPPERMKVPGLMRGHLWQNDNSIYGKGFYKDAVERMIEREKAGKVVFLHKEQAVPGRWRQAWVFRKQDQPLSVPRAEAFYAIWQATSQALVREALQSHDLVQADGTVSYTQVRLLMADHTLVFENENGRIMDTHRDFVGTAITEHSLFVSIKQKLIEFETLTTGDPPPAKVARTKAQEEAKRKRAEAAAAYDSPPRFAERLEVDSRGRAIPPPAPPPVIDAFRDPSMCSRFERTDRQNTMHPSWEATARGGQPASSSAPAPAFPPKIPSETERAAHAERQKELLRQTVSQEPDPNKESFIECCSCKVWRKVPYGHFLNYHNQDRTWTCKLAGYKCEAGKRRKAS